MACDTSVNTKITDTAQNVSWLWNILKTKSPFGIPTISQDSKYEIYTIS